jgi:hypothetical protein
MPAKALRGEVDLKMPDGSSITLRAGIGEFEDLDVEIEGGVQGVLERCTTGALRMSDVTHLIRVGLLGRSPGCDVTLDEARATIRDAGYPIAARTAMLLLLTGLGLTGSKKDGAADVGLQPNAAATTEASRSPDISGSGSGFLSLTC